MGADQNYDWNQHAASTLDWWREAGVDALIDEVPHDWLAPPHPVHPVTVADAVAVPKHAPEPVATDLPLPQTLAEFVTWRAGPDAPESTWSGTPVAAQGPDNADLMILIDLPDREDAESGVLMSGAVGRLFDHMLAAIGRDRASIYLVPVCTMRPAAGRVAPEIEARLNEIARRHVALAGPKRVLLLGNAPSRALLGADAVRMRGSLHVINLTSGTVDINVVAVASFHPRFLLERPAAKAEAWKDLQMLIGGWDA